MAALPKKTSCKICPHYTEIHCFGRKIPERYCMKKGEGQRRRISARVPKRSLPDWCPIYRNPPALRVYALTEMGSFMQFMGELHDGKSDRLLLPMNHQYYLRLETESQTTARKLCSEIQDLQMEQYADMQDVAEKLGTKVAMHEVLEFDDGIQQIFLYLCRDSRDRLSLREIWFDKEHIRPTKSGQ